ncbi:RRQRL motif-containing zinc-binding protein [Glycomyces tarimensis]
MAFRAEFDDPEGTRFGLPTFNYRHAPRGLATRRQLAAKGLTPGRQDIAAQILWWRGKRRAYLYREDLARPKREATPAQLRALMRAWVALSTCPTCRREFDHYIPRRFGECLECHQAGTGAAR